MGIETGTAALVTGIIGALAAGGQTGLTIAQQQAAAREARRQRRRTFGLLEEQRGREQEAIRALRRQITGGDITQRLRTAGLEQVQERFGRAIEQIESNLRRRGLPGQAEAQVAQARGRQAEAEAALARDIALQEQQRRTGIVQQLAQLGAGTVLPSAALQQQLEQLSSQQALAERRAQQAFAALPGQLIGQTGQLVTALGRLNRPGTSDIGEALERLLFNRDVAGVTQAVGPPRLPGPASFQFNRAPQLVSPSTR